MRVVDFSVSTDPTSARQAVGGYLEQDGFRLTWKDDWSATAERGSSTKQFFLGAFAEYFKFGFHVFTGEGGVTVVRIEKVATGWMAGAIGGSRAKRRFEAMRESLSAWFGQQGQLLGVLDHDI